jgi:hypothetical protein
MATHRSCASSPASPVTIPKWEITETNLSYPQLPYSMHPHSLPPTHTAPHGRISRSDTGGKHQGTKHLRMPGRSSIDHASHTPSMFTRSTQENSAPFSVSRRSLRYIPFRAPGGETGMETLNPRLVCRPSTSSAGFWPPDPRVTAVLIPHLPASMPFASKSTTR